MSTRRHFLQTGPALLTAAGLAGAGQSVSSSDRIRVATIGFGGMGIGDTRYALAVPGVELAAVCGIHDGPLTRAREVHGDRIFTTRDYREVLARKDIDAVIVATPDHWHAALSIAAMEAGKDVYCEKPMVQSVVDGNAVIAAQERTGRIFQVGSQYVASAVYQKARELVQSGAIGRLTMVEAWLDRNTALGAWQYSIPPDSIGAFPKAVQEEFMRQYRQQYPAGGSRPRRSSRRGSRPHPGMTPTRSTTGFSTKPCAAARSR